MKNRLCELLGIEYPIIQGGMAWVATAELAAAVSNGGGLGLIAAGGAPADVVRAEIRKCRELTDKPFGVNVMLMSPFAEEVMQVIIEEKPAVVATGAGNPGKYIEPLKNAGVKILPVIASVAMAQKMEKQGADAVIAEGTEAGRHRRSRLRRADGAQNRHSRIQADRFRSGRTRRGYEGPAHRGRRTAG